MESTINFSKLEKSTGLNNAPYYFSGLCTTLSVQYRNFYITVYYIVQAY